MLEICHDENFRQLSPLEMVPYFLSFTAQNNSSLKKKSADENFKDVYVIASTISHNVGTAYGDLQEIVEHIFTKLT